MWFLYWTLSCCSNRSKNNNVIFPSWCLTLGQSYSSVNIKSAIWNNINGAFWMYWLWIFLKFRVNHLIKDPLLLVILLLCGNISMFILIDFYSCQTLSMFYELPGWLKQILSVYTWFTQTLLIWWFNALWRLFGKGFTLEIVSGID